MNLAPKYSRHIFVTDRLSRPCAGPAHEPAAAAMGNSLYQWMKTYFPTFQLEQMRQSQLAMEAYRQETLRLRGVAAADPLVLLMGAATPQPAAPARQTIEAEQLRQVLTQLQQMLPDAATATGGAAEAAALPGAAAMPGPPPPGQVACAGGNVAGPSAAAPAESSDVMMTASSGSSFSGSELDG